MKPSRSRASFQFKATLASFAMLAAGALLTSPSTQAATLYYDGGTNTWVNTSFSTDPANPTPDPAAAPGIGDDIIFNISGNNAVANILSLGGNQSANSLTFNNTGTNAIRGTAAGQTLTLGAGGILINSGAGAITIGSATPANAAGVLLGASQTWTNNSASALTVLNTITNAGDVTPFTLTIAGTGAGTTTLGGVISNGGTTGTTSLVKSGTGTLVLSGANTFSGGVTLNTGTLNVGNATALGTGALTITGGTINTNGAALALTANNAININGNFTFTGSNSLNLGTGAVTLGGGTRTITANALTLTIGGNIGDGGNAYGLTKAGAGTLLLAGTNTYGGTTGVTTITAGTLQAATPGSLPGAGTAGRVVVGAAGALTVNAGGANQFTSANISSLLGAATLTSGARFGIDTTGGDFTYTAALAGSAGSNGFGLNKLGANTLTLTTASTNTAFTTVSLGTLSVSADNQLGTGTAGVFLGSGSTTSTGATLLITGNSTFTSSRNFGQAAGTFNNFVIDVAPGSTGTLNGNFDNRNGGSGNSNGAGSAGIGFGYQAPVAGTANGILNLGGTLLISNNTNSALDGYRFRNITANITGALTVGGTNNPGDSIIIGLGSNETTVVNLGGASGQLNVGTGLDITMGGSNGTLANFGSPAGGVIGGTAALPSTTTLNINGTNAAAVTARNLYVGRNGFTTATVNHNSGGVSLVGSVILGSGNVNTVGTYNLGNGTNSTALLTTSAVTRGTGTGTLDFNGGSLVASANTVAFLGTGTTAVTANVDTGGARINTGAFSVGVAQGLTHAPALGAALDGGLTKLGSGTLTLNGASTYTGPTTISGGMLALGSGGTLANSSAINVTATTTTLDVSAVTGGFALGTAQSLTNNGTVNGALTSGGNLLGDGGVFNNAVTTTGGTISPGGTAALGTLTFGGNLSLTGTAYRLTISASGSDLLDASTVALTLGAGSSVTLNILPGGTLQTSYDVTNYGALTGTFADTSNLLAQGYTLDYTTSPGQILLVAVPEPGTWMLVAGGFTALFTSRKLRRRQVQD